MLATLANGADSSEKATGLSTVDSVAQLVSLLVIFVLVLGLTLFVTRWIANYQKGSKICSNIEVLETYAVGNGKYIQIVRLAETYVAMAVCKDTVTVLAQIPKEQIAFPEEGKGTMHFKELLQKAKNAQSGKEDTMVEDSLKEE